MSGTLASHQPARTGHRCDKKQFCVCAVKVKKKKKKQYKSQSAVSSIEMEEFLVESSTYFKLVPSLATMARGLKKNANHHDHLVGIFILLMDESGFRLDDSNTGWRPTKDAQSVTVDPDDWRSSGSSNSYELRFRHERVDELLDCKIVALTRGDIILVNLCPTRHDGSDVTRTRSAVFQTLKYVNPHSSDLAGRFMNLRELSHRFKDSLTTPMKGEILTNAGITNASLSGLPTELKLRIFGMLKFRDWCNVSKTCCEFRDLQDYLVWEWFVR